MIETSATLLSSEMRPNEEFCCMRKDPDRQCHELLFLTLLICSSGDIKK
jgi:hypothetical protein